MKYEARMEGASEEITADTLAEAIEQAEEWARDGSWDTGEGTIWVHAHLIEMGDDGEEIERHSITVQIDPDEPDCTSDEGHDWQAPYEIVGGIKENPGVWGHGGGVTIQEACLHCGCGKLTDTWAQDPETGEQGLDSTAYQPDKYTDEVSDLMRERVEFEVAHSLNEGQALVIACVDDISATYIVAAEEKDDPGYSYADTDTWPLSGDWPDPPADLIDEARELAAAWEGV